MRPPAAVPEVQMIIRVRERIPRARRFESDAGVRQIPRCAGPSSALKGKTRWGCRRSRSHSSRPYSASGSSNFAASPPPRSGFSIGRVIMAVPRRMRSVCAAAWRGRLPAATAGRLRAHENGGWSDPRAVESQAFRVANLLGGQPVALFRRESVVQQTGEKAQSFTRHATSLLGMKSGESRR